MCQFFFAPQVLFPLELSLHKSTVYIAYRAWDFFNNTLKKMCLCFFFTSILYSSLSYSIANEILFSSFCKIKTFIFYQLCFDVFFFLHLWTISFTWIGRDWSGHLNNLIPFTLVTRILSVLFSGPSCFCCCYIFFSLRLKIFSKICFFYFFSSLKSPFFIFFIAETALKN